MVLSEPVDSLPNTSPVTIRRFKSLGLLTYWDLLNYFPFRYEDYSIISPISKVQEGEQVTIQGKVIDAINIFTRTGLKIQKIKLQDESGIIELNWYNQQYLLRLFHTGEYLSASGEAKRIGNRMIVLPKEYELMNQQDLKHTGRIVPVYSEKNRLSSKTIRDKIWTVLQFLNIKEPLPKDIVQYNNLLDEESGYREIHFPSTLQNAQRAKERLSFDELFLLQLNSKLVKREWEKETVGNPFVINTVMKNRLDDFIKSLPFELTNSQKKAVHEISQDLQMSRPMNRFLQGEVGSGKTVVAAIACYISYLNGFQSLMMAPTEILAEQHFHTIQQLFKNLKICLVTGSSKPSVKDLENADIIIGTHALIQKKISYKKVGFVVIDEQHRFGVAQRAELKNKGLNPHLLTMTATPIPRTVMLTLYGELDISILDDMPIGRLPIKTFFIQKQKRNDCYKWIKKQIREKGAQVYIICPLIEESEIETLQSLKAVKKEFDYLKSEVFKEYSLGLLHGKLSSKEKNNVMEDFKNKKSDILVSTPVVEVGIDVPSATIMIIEGGERFGLAQLHQLRGRIGRGNKESYCFVFSEKEGQDISQRLFFFTKTQKGNELAEKDLKLRGPGNLYGIEQHGYLDLKIASMNDYPMIEKTRKAVEYFLKKYQLGKFQELKKRVANMKIGQIAKD